MCFFNHSSCDKSACDSQSPDSWTEQATSIPHPWLFSWVSRSSYLHQDTSEWKKTFVLFGFCLKSVMLGKRVCIFIVALFQNTLSASLAQYSSFAHCTCLSFMADICSCLKTCACWRSVLACSTRVLVVFGTWSVFIESSDCTCCVLRALQTYREPVSDYQVLREKAASQRRDVERALTRFMAKTGETQSLFKDDVSTFPCELSRKLVLWRTDI